MTRTQKLTLESLGPESEAQFGTLSQTNPLFGMDPLVRANFLGQDAGIPVEYKQDLASKGRYRIDMEESDMHAGYASSEFYVPRTIQKIPDIAEWRMRRETGPVEMKCLHGQETGLMEGPQGLFLEECETIQGIQFMHDTSTSTFASFANALLTSSPTTWTDEVCSTELETATLPLRTQCNLGAMILQGHSKKKADMELARAREAEKAARSYDSLFNVEPEDTEGGGASRNQRRSWRKISCHLAGTDALSSHGQIVFLLPSLRSHIAPHSDRRHSSESWVFGDIFWEHQGTEDSWFAAEKSCGGAVVAPSETVSAVLSIVFLRRLTAICGTLERAFIMYGHPNDLVYSYVLGLTPVFLPDD
ncbi:hypothetical protein B0H13DRAFT_1909923 [Mycena leptocephala]|nr:hypothetical protein B0H13DRAFT_1909923 [Mycena leptocephala]